MSIKILLSLSLLVLPSIAQAEMGGKTDRDRVNREVETMMRDGRWERAVAEGRANREAFEALRQSQTGRAGVQYSRSGQAARPAGG